MSSLPRYALSLCVALAVLAGCGPEDGSKELEQGREAYEKQHDLKKAERLFEKSAELNATNVEAFVYLTRVNIDLGNMPAANKWIAKAAEMSGGSLDVKLLRAQLAWHGKDYDTAAKLFSGVAEDKSLGAAERAQGWTGLGIVEMTRDRRHQAHCALPSYQGVPLCVWCGRSVLRGQFLSGFAMERYHLYEHISGAVVQAVCQGRDSPGL